MSAAAAAPPLPPCAATAAAVGHDLAHTLAFVQCLVEDGALPEADSGRGRAEIERLRACIAALRRLAGSGVAPAAEGPPCGS